jgi:methylmalonyl-CoA mutase
MKAARALRQAGVKSLSLAGYPKAQIEVLREAGVQHFVHLGCDAVATLNAVQDLIF